MEMPAHRTWMYYKLIAGRRGYTVEFFQGVKEFLDFACQQPQYLNEGVIKCPCRLCKNERDLTPNEVNVHIRQEGFTPGYWYWTLHGEEVPQINLDVDMHSDSMPCNNNQQVMEFDDADLNDQNSVQNEEVSPNVEATEFYDTLNSTQQPLRSAYKNTSNMSTAAFTMLNLKSKHNMSQDCFNDLMKIMRESSHAKNKIPSNSRETKRNLEPSKMLRKKKCAQPRAPLIIPPDTVQATQPPPQTKPQTKFNRLQPTKPLTRLQLRSQSQLSQPQLPLQPQPSKSRPQPQIRLLPQPTQPRPQPQLRLQAQPTKSQPQPTSRPPQSRRLPQLTPPQPQPLPSRSQTIPTQVLQCQESPMVNETPSSSSNHVSEESNVNKFLILPEGDGFDQHKLVVKAIALIICTNLKEGKPSWKQLSKKQRDSWFDIFKSKFTWPHEHKDMVRQLKAHWESSKYKRMSEINKRNAESMAGAFLHTGGSIPHRLHWKRLKEAKGTDPSLEEFYFRTHRKKDQSWVGPCAESAYDKFEQRKLELSSKLVSVENGGFAGSSSHPHLSHQHRNDSDGDHME
ncbi:hypothetical protein P8452_74017 [Trifolium repens]|nr:hypothetical protein P8452_74017 [Trifolium repens]